MDRIIERLPDNIGLNDMLRALSKEVGELNVGFGKTKSVLDRLEESVLRYHETNDARVNKVERDITKIFAGLGVLLVLATAIVFPAMLKVFDYFLNVLKH